MKPVVIDLRKVLPYAPDDLHALVSDVRAYPKFIPWVQSLALVLEDESASGWTGRATATVGWRAFTERFETRVRARHADCATDVSLIQGPFHILTNAWRFAARPDGSSTLDFSLAYRFRNPVLQAVAAANRDLAVRRIMGAFLDEAARRYAKAPARAEP